MDRRERSGDPVTTMLAAFEGLQSTIWTAMPGILQSFDAVKQTCVILPALQAQVQQPDGSFVDVTLPPLLDCPVVFPGGGGVTLTFPLAKGDECLVIFASRCIDNWWQNGPGADNQTASTQAELRMHSLSDGFCVPGARSVPKVIPSVSTTKTQLRNDAGTTFLELDPTTGKMALHATEFDVVAPTTNFTGNVHVTGTITASVDVVGAGTSLHSHVHTSAAPGSPTSAPL